MRYILLVLITTFLNANISDDINIYKAQDAYNNKNLKQSEEYYKKISEKSDEIKYNLANILYKQKKYDEAISWYSEIASQDMLYKKHHNLGNAYAKLGKEDTAIKNYKEALKIQDDKDTKFNLDLLKNKKKKEEQKKNKKKNSKDKKRKSDKQKDKKDDMDDEDKKDEKTTSNKKQAQIKEKKDNKSKNKDNAKNSKKEQIKKQDENITKEENLKNTELSNLEEKRWTKMINNRELNTLMIPLKNEGENNDENIKPW